MAKYIKEEDVVKNSAIEIVEKVSDCLIKVFIFKYIVNAFRFVQK